MSLTEDQRCDMWEYFMDGGHPPGTPRPPYTRRPGYGGRAGESVSDCGWFKVWRTALGWVGIDYMNLDRQVGPFPNRCDAYKALGYDPRRKPRQRRAA